MSILSRLLPTPSTLMIPAVGLDFSDATMRFVRLKEGAHGILPSMYAELTIPDGCMLGGRIVDEIKFTQFLKEGKKKYNLTYVRVSIPESQVYSFTIKPQASSLSC